MVVVDDDDVDAARAAELQGFVVAGAAVAGQHQGAALLGEGRGVIAGEKP